MHKNVTSLRPTVDNVCMSDTKQILNKEINFYASLYAKDNLENNINYHDNIKMLFDIQALKLQGEGKSICEGLILSKECVRVINE